ncbi:heme o synthase [Microaerobacter geothermalis]|uniref:heme o synthase n=1 Tax=Microaerobacter geothermalis TaxID=674972 RepID=UPI001F364C44|nr:heme o synthase [Microaerobacter geothermalis]MCF6093644.1 heme o synthase [Microaerobacter geothermalis]
MERSISIESSVDHSVRDTVKAKASIKDYIMMTKPGITSSNVLGTLAGFMLAMGGSWFTTSSLWTLLWTVVGITLVISSGTTLNNVFDRDIDKYMERTQDRAITNGRISSRRATVLGIIFAILGEGILTLGVNPLAAILAFIGLFDYVVLYTAWSKRTTTLNTVIGGISGAMPLLTGYVAVTESLDIVAWTLFSFMFLWQTPHFLALAMRRVEEYRRVNIPMLPVVIGFKGTKRQILFYTAALVPVSLLLYYYQVVGALYLWVTGILGIIYLALAVKGVFIKEEKDIQWANIMFRYSIIYLTVIFLLLMVNAQ